MLLDCTRIETRDVRLLPRITIKIDDRYILLIARPNRIDNATQLQRPLLLATGRGASSKTVRNRLYQGARIVYVRRPMICIPLISCHCAARRRWAAGHRDWKKHYWSQVLFTDESRISLESDTRSVLVWRERGTRNNPTFVRERSQCRRAGWMARGEINIGGCTNLHIIRNGNLTGRRYIEEILRPHETLSYLKLQPLEVPLFSSMIMPDHIHLVL